MARRATAVMVALGAGWSGACGTGATCPPGALQTVIVRLAGPAQLEPARGRSRALRAGGVARELQARFEEGQRAVRTLLERRRAEGAVSRVEPLWIVNGLSVTATPAVIAALRARSDVISVTSDAVQIVPAAAPVGTGGWNLEAIGAPAVWRAGARGQGAVVALLDTGADASHPDLAGRFRGGARDWFDPYGQRAAPFDASGHGTQVLGVAVGGEASGTPIGVAPGATWIAARVFDDSGAATATAIHQAFQWALDPDGDPATADAPDVVNASWSFAGTGCHPEFRADVQALRAAGILPVFAAGSAGPAPGSSVSPANYPESLAIGAVDEAGAPLAESGRGPAACGDGLYPSLAAPGEGIRSAGRFGTWATGSGTSLAAAHVSGALALLAGAFPQVAPERLEAALRHTARPAGAGADDAVGEGVVDLARARDELEALAPQVPLGAADGWAVEAGEPLAVGPPGVLANDAAPSGLALAATLESGPAHGVLTLRADGGFAYAPRPGFRGLDTFRYRASDGSFRSAATTVALRVGRPAGGVLVEPQAQECR